VTWKSIKDQGTVINLHTLQWGHVDEDVEEQQYEFAIITVNLLQWGHVDK
jgi:hypothetical protein